MNDERGAGQIRRRGFIGRGLLAVVMAIASATRGPAGEPVAAPDQPGRGVLDLPGDGHLPGGLVPTDGGLDTPRTSLLWRSPLFTEPFAFRVDQVHGVRLAAAERATKPAGGWRIHLRGGDLLVGDIESIDARAVAVAVGGRKPAVRIDRSVVERMVRGDAGTPEGFIGPGELADWRQTPPASWRQESGGLTTDSRMASIVRDVLAPPRARYDVSISWKGRQPEFRLAVAADEKSPEADGYRLEMLSVAGQDVGLAAVRQEADKAEIGLLDGVPTTGQTLRLSLFVDQAAGRFAIATARDDRLVKVAEVAMLPAAGRRPSGAVRLTGLTGSVRLESLRISPWTARDLVDDAPVGTTIRGRGLRLDDVVVDALEGEDLVVRQGDASKRLPIAGIDEIVITAPAAAAADAPPRSVRLVGTSGQSLSGDLVKVDREMIWIRRAGIDAAVGMALAEMLAVRSLQSAPAADLPGRSGRLQAGDAVTDGCIAATAAGLGWRPRGAENASPFAVTASGGAPDVTVAYVKPDRTGTDLEEPLGGIGGQVVLNDEGFFVVAMMTEDGAAAKDGRLGAGDRIIGIAPEKGAAFVDTKGLDQETVMNLLRGRIGTPVRLRVARDGNDEPEVIELARGSINIMNSEMLQIALEVHARLAPPAGVPVDPRMEFPAKLFLRTGDVLPCAVHGLTAADVRITTPVSSGTQEIAVPSALAQAAELLPSAGRGIDKARAERLLTLPRMQRAEPPRHLLRLENGDYVRGTIESLDGESIRIDLQGVIKQFPRAAVSRVIWLHPEDLVTAGAGKPPVDQPKQEGKPGIEGQPVVPGDARAKFLIQGVARDGRRLTLEPKAVQDNVVSGTSAAIGGCRIDLERVDRLLFGAAIERESANLPYRQWKLRPAAEPRALKAEPPPPENTRS
jgi:hypothetical protein